MTRKTKYTLVLKPELRQELRNPLGILIKGTPQKAIEQLEDLISKEKPRLIISVGDVVSQNMLKHGIQPNIVIVDGKVMREKTKPINAKIGKKVVVQNPAATITPQSWVAVKEAVGQETPTLIAIEGEEDLLTLVAVLEAPKNSLVIYGQPREGIVAVKVDEAARNKVKLIINAMETLPKS